jgi:hypothetical protein
MKPGSTRQLTEENTMKRFAISSMLAGGLFAGLLGASGVAHADLSDIIWNNNQQQRAYVPHVDTSVKNSPVIVRH